MLSLNWYLSKKRQMATSLSYFSQYSRRKPNVTSQFDRSRMEINPVFLPAERNGRAGRPWKPHRQLPRNGSHRNRQNDHQPGLRDRPCVNDDFLESIRHPEHYVQMGQSFESQILLVPVYDDTPLISKHLQHFLAEAASHHQFRRIQLPAAVSTSSGKLHFRCGPDGRSRIFVAIK